MTDAAFDRDAYLERVGLSAPPAHTPDGLASLHRAQAHAIPFENFDIQLGRPLDLSPGGLFRKLVGRPRGGYCFELNGLLLAALRHFGFDARPLLARVHLTGEATPRTHQLTLVALDGHEWLVDAGFGADSPGAPILHEIGRVARPDGVAHRLVPHALGTMLEADRAGGWQPLYSFDLTPVLPADIACGNHYTATHPARFFTFTRVATIPRAEGRTSLRNFTLRTLVGDRETTAELAPGAAYLEALATHFGIRLDADYEDLRPLPDVTLGNDARQLPT